MIFIRLAFFILLALVGGASASPVWADSGLERSRFLRSVEVRVGDRLPLPAWERVQPAIERDEGKLKDCLGSGNCRDRTAARLVSFLSTLTDLERARQLEAVNDYFNRITYAAEGFGSRDTWQAPLAFLRYAGDCEDFAIAKYVALRLLGFEERDLRLVVGMDGKRGQAHAVLLVRLQQKFFVLDNLEPLGTDTRFAHFRPLYAVNAENRWLLVAESGSPQVAGRPGVVAAAAPLQ